PRTADEPLGAMAPVPAVGPGESRGHRPGVRAAVRLCQAVAHHVLAAGDAAEQLALLVLAPGEHHGDRAEPADERDDGYSRRYSGDLLDHHRHRERAAAPAAELFRIPHGHQLVLDEERVNVVRELVRG